MIIQKTVLIQLNPQNIKHYESLGYFIPRYKNIKHNMVIKRGTKIEVKVSDLPPNTNTSKVLCKCDNPDCKSKPKLVAYQSVKKVGKYLCKKCAMNEPDVKDKLRKARIGRKASIDTKRKMSNSRKGKKHSEESKRKIARFGSENASWNPRLTNEERNQKHHISGIDKWKKEVRERDNYTCQKCGSKEHLCIHHINNFKNFKDQRLYIDNGITLCINCHKAIHKQFGSFTKKENLKEFLNQFFQQIHLK